jgi:hypothetical protein
LSFDNDTTVKIHFDDYVRNSKQLANIYERGSSTPLAVYRYDGDGQEMIELDPKRNLKRDTRYTVKVTTGVNDGANNLEAPYSWSFKTRG